MGDKGFFLIFSDDLAVIIVKRRNCGEGCRSRGPGKPASGRQQDPVKAALTASSVTPTWRRHLPPSWIWWPRRGRELFPQGLQGTGAHAVGATQARVGQRCRDAS